MPGEPDYAKLTIPSDKPEDEFTWQQRRAVIYEDLKRAGHYRNLPYTHRDYGNRFGVSHTQIRLDIERLIEYEAERLGEQAETELELVKSSAVSDWVQAAENARAENDYETAATCMSNAYSLISKHYRTLMDVGLIENGDELEWNVSSEVVEVVEPDAQ